MRDRGSTVEVRGAGRRAVSRGPRRPPVRVPGWAPSARTPGRTRFVQARRPETQARGPGPSARGRCSVVGRSRRRGPRSRLPAGAAPIPGRARPAARPRPAPGAERCSCEGAAPSRGARRLPCRAVRREPARVHGRRSARRDRPYRFRGANAGGRVAWMRSPIPVGPAATQARQDPDRCVSSVPPIRWCRRTLSNREGAPAVDQARGWA